MAGDLAKSLVDAIGDSIVNPRCCDCGRSMSTPAPHQIGMPRQCGHCQQIMERRFAAVAADFISQERPRGRRIHVVKLPEGMSDHPAPSLKSEVRS